MPELEQKPFQKRQVAYKIKISDILNGKFTKNNLSAGYIKINNNFVSRINIMSTVVYKSEQGNYASVVIDDGTGRILLRSFENSSLFAKVDVGDVALVIGRIREFNNEKYILPEILKKINNIDWLNVRRLELSKNFVKEETKIPDTIMKIDTAKEINSDDDNIYSIVKNLDNGDGVSIEDVIKSSKNNNVEHIINKLLENGDIFELKPGRLKVLE